MIHDPILSWLLTKGNEQGYLTHEDILAVLPGTEQDEVSKLDDLLEHLADAGISVLAASPDTDANDEDDDSNANPDGLATVTKADLTDDAGYQQALNTDDVIGLYLKEAGRIPLLTAEQEVSLAKRIEAGEFAQAQLDEYGDQLPPEERLQIEALLIDATAAEEHLIRANARLVISIAKKYVGRGVPFLDLIQEGNIGLIRAVRKFEYQRGNKFSTYATWWIRQAVSRAVADQGRTIRVPVHLGDQINKLLRISSQLAQELGRDPVIEEIAARLEITPDRAAELMAISRRPISLESPTGEEQDAVIGDFIEDENVPSPPEVVAQQLLSGEINKLLRWLPEREAYILKLRYGLDNGRIHTLEEVGRKIGVTRERVRQLEAQALNRLRHSSALMLRDYLTEESAVASQRNLTLWLWPLALVVAGVLLLLHNYLLLDFDVLQLWPLLLVTLGVQTILRGDLGFSWATQTFGITRGSVESATLRTNSGELDICVHTIQRADRLIAGQYTARSRPSLQVDSNHATLTMLRENTWMLSLGNWDFALADNLPWDLLLSTHLGKIEADMRGLVIEHAHISTGVGDIHLIAPDNPAGPIVVRSTLGNIYLTIPDNMEAAITWHGSPVFGLRLQKSRWQTRDKGLLVTPGYDEAIEPLELTVSGTFGDLILS